MLACIVGKLLLKGFALQGLVHRYTCICKNSVFRNYFENGGVQNVMSERPVYVWTGPESRGTKKILTQNCVSALVGYLEIGLDSV